MTDAQEIRAALEAAEAEIRRLLGEVEWQRSFRRKVRAERYRLAAIVDRVREILAEHPGSAWDSGIKLRAALLEALDAPVRPVNADLSPERATTRPNHTEAEREAYRLGWAEGRLGAPSDPPHTSHESGCCRG